MEKLLFIYYSLLFCLATITFKCSATTYTVGDSSGWDISTNLDTWIADKMFKVGDALVFQYSSGQSVEEVTKENYDTCNTTNVLATYGNGNTTVPLTRGGDRYFVSGNKLYCLGGMKLHVHVEGDDKSLAPTIAPKAVAGSDENTATLSHSPSSKKSTHLSAGTVHYCARNVLISFIMEKFDHCPKASLLPHASEAMASLGGLQNVTGINLLFKEGPKVNAKFELKPPPYPLNGLEPVMSQQTLEFHWGKHHRAYVENLKKQVVGSELDGKSLEEIIVTSYNKGDILPAFNNAAQVWNHDFFWECMKPGGGGKPSGELLELIERDFGSFEKFLDEFKAAAATQFGSGWAWLAYRASKLNGENAENPPSAHEDNKLVVIKSPNAVNPLVWGSYYPLLTIDVWEHAYYLDFQNRRPDYISVFMDKLVSWDAVSSRLEQAKAFSA
ncbi:hypothetical protein VNO80_15780 [Phaseolus coccineus]|uniref:superoxide dismutase n=2 Tax=Phaseolus TaxID=3883 RepID=A0AAN9R240_PHACN